MSPPIFIGGVGRSGTTILYETLGCHQDIHALPTEMRFLVDPDGLIDLIDALTIHYSPAKAREALFRFERLMRIYLANPRTIPYRGFDFPNWFGGEYYWQNLDKFCSELVELEYQGVTWEVASINEGRFIEWARGLQRLGQKLQGHPSPPRAPELPQTQLRVVKYFSNRQELITLAATLTDNLFREAARKNGKKIWCEKTPHNRLYLDFLWELFPESFLIHIKRDPRGVAFSFTQQRWAPDDIDGVCLYLRNGYKRWFDIKNAIELDPHRYYEIKLEDFASDPKAMLEQIASFCNLQNSFGNIPTITIDKVDYWKEAMTPEQIHTVNEMLGPYIEQMGYEI